ncbi:MAG: tRNA (adenosine(37)-N6)-dimethylallyltransferase MiaA [Clostridiaceae bacterium]|jgi:tRNA dimethylallyltransferase|nr:tRNA (adenosine(37)-N6)-dimethylallyltransferase MiaA [Clostridiaceae bacterium]
MNKNDQTVIVITGPTASGKSETAMQVARAIRGEVVSADSMQIYRGLDIGTAKPSLTERMEIPHHLIDILDLDQTFNVAEYYRLAVDTIRDIHSRNQRAIVCGGTGQYLSALMDGLTFSPVPADPQLRQTLNEKADQIGLDQMWAELNAVDPIAAQWISPGDRKRMIRALEVNAVTGQPISYHVQQSKRFAPEFSFAAFCLTHDRPDLYDRINKRVYQMIDQGLLDEVKMLIEHNLPKGSTCLQAIGYKELIGYLEEREELTQAIQRLQQATRRYAKRQLTWFRKMDSLIWIANQTPQEACETILRAAGING